MSDARYVFEQQRFEGFLKAKLKALKIVLAGQLEHPEPALMSKSPDAWELTQTPQRPVPRSSGFGQGSRATLGAPAAGLFRALQSPARRPRNQVARPPHLEPGSPQRLRRQMARKALQPLQSPNARVRRSCKQGLSKAAQEKWGWRVHNLSLDVNSGNLKRYFSTKAQPLAKTLPDTPRQSSIASFFKKRN